MEHATYVGPREDLKGETALIRPAYESTDVMAQFDDMDLPEAFGWHRFPSGHFTIDQAPK